MAKKKENIATILKAEIEKGHYEVVYDDPDFNEVRVKTATGVYQFPYDEDIWKGIESRLRSLDRLLANHQNYGDDRGKAGVWKDNKTCLALAAIKASPMLPAEGKYLRLMQQFAAQAPREVAPWLFLNLYDRMGDAGVTLTIKTTYNIAFIMPPAWSEGYEDLHTFDGLSLQTELCNLTPRYKKGDVITHHDRRRHEDTKAEVLSVIYKQYYQKPYMNKYGNVEYMGEGPYVVWYHTAYGNFRYDEV